MKKCFQVLLIATLLILPGYLFPQGSTNLKLLAKVNPSPGTTYSEVTSCGDLAIIGAFQSNSFVWIYEVSNKTIPELLSSIPITRGVLDVQVHGRYLFISFRDGMAWYDILNPRQPKFVKDFTPSPSINAHTSFVSGNTLFIADQVSRGIRIFDITDKKNPLPLAALADPGWTIHDMTIIRGRLYGAWIFGQPGGELMLANVNNPAQPRVLAKTRYPNAGTHNAWPTEDEQFILSTDEVGGTRHNLKIWDARTPGQLIQVADYIPPSVVSPSAIIHNVYVRGRYAYMSYYCEGVHIVDIADPTNPQEVAFYDLNGAALCTSYNSNWGVDPFANLIYASDMQQGLHIFEFADHPAANITGKVVDAVSNAAVNGAMVYFLDEFPSTRNNAAGEFGIPWFKNDTVRVVTEAFGYRPDTSIVITRANAPSPVTIRLHGTPRLAVVKPQIDDDKSGGSFGNGNGLIDGVETFELNFDLQNIGFGNLTNGTVELSSADPCVKLIETKQTLGPIGAGQTGVLNGALRFTLSALVPSNKLAFKLAATLNNATQQEIDFELLVQMTEIRNFRATPAANSITLFWDAANEALLEGYQLYLKPAREPDTAFTKLTTTPITNTTFTIIGLTPGETLSLAITKVVNGIESLAGARLEAVVRIGAPENFALLPNYPNPFSPAALGLVNTAGTQIAFQLARREQVQLEIFNMLGQRVRELLNASREPGQHTILWDATNDANQRVAAGVYILRMRAGEFIAERKLALAR